MEGAQVVVILLTACLVLFLIVIVALVVIVLRLTLRIKSLMHSTEDMAQNIVGAVSTAKGASVLFNLIKTVIKKGKKGGRRE